MKADTPDLTTGSSEFGPLIIGKAEKEALPPPGTGFDAGSFRLSKCFFEEEEGGVVGFTGDDGVETSKQEGLLGNVGVSS